MAEQKAKEDAEKATKRAAGFQSQLEKSRKESKERQDQIKELKHELAIVRQDRRMLGVRPAPVEPEERAAIQQAVHEKIKRQRKNSASVDEPVQLSELRAHDKAIVSDILKHHRNLLVPWSRILAKCVVGHQRVKFTSLPGITDFIDGFQLAVPDDFTTSDLQSFLKQHMLEVKISRARKFLEEGSKVRMTVRRQPICSTVPFVICPVVPFAERAELRWDLGVGMW